MKLYGDTISFADSSVITRTEFYLKGVAMPERTVAMSGQDYVPCNDNYVIGGVAVMFFVLVLAFVLERVTYPYRLKAFFSNKRLYIDEGMGENSGGALSTFLLISIGALCLALIFFSNMASTHGFDMDMGVPYWIIAVVYLACMLLVYIKYIVYSFVNWVFHSSEERQRWRSGYFLVTSLAAFLLYPATLLYLFQPNCHELVTVCVIFIAIMYEFLLLYKFIVNFKAKEYGYLLLFLYFCSVELMPAVVIWHAFDWMNNNFIVKNLIY